MPSRLAKSLAVLIAATPEGQDDWWLIGSTAACLCGIDLEPQDVDLLASTATISAFAGRLGGAVA